MVYRNFWNKSMHWKLAPPISDLTSAPVLFHFSWEPPAVAQIHPTATLSFFPIPQPAVPFGYTILCHTGFLCNRLKYHTLLSIVVSRLYLPLLSHMLWCICQNLHSKTSFKIHKDLVPGSPGYWNLEIQVSSASSYISIKFPHTFWAFLDDLYIVIECKYYVNSLENNKKACIYVQFWQQLPLVIFSIQCVDSVDMEPQFWERLYSVCVTP